MLPSKSFDEAVGCAAVILAVVLIHSAYIAIRLSCLRAPGRRGARSFGSSCCRRRVRAREHHCPQKTTQPRASRRRAPVRPPGVWTSVDRPASLAPPGVWILPTTARPPGRWLATGVQGLRMGLPGTETGRSDRLLPARPPGLHWKSGFGPTGALRSHKCTSVAVRTDMCQLQAECRPAPLSRPGRTGAGPSARREVSLEQSTAQAGWPLHKFLPSTRSRAAPDMARAVQRCGGARGWLLEVRRSRRRIGRKALADIWDAAEEADRLLRALTDLAEASSSSAKRVHDNFRLFIAASDPLADSLRRLAAWHHLHTFGDRRASDLIRTGPMPWDVAPGWLVRQAKRTKRVTSKGSSWRHSSAPSGLWEAAHLPPRWLASAHSF